jgi:tetrahydromethanopterin S-methyltransferase subunit G
MNESSDIEDVKQRLEEIERKGVGRGEISFSPPARSE